MVSAHSLIPPIEGKACLLEDVLLLPGAAVRRGEVIPSNFYTFAIIFAITP
jgi:hypothetical protein